MAFEDLVGDLVEDDEVQIDQVLSDRHEAFCKNFVINGGNATQAYIACGYSAATAGPASSRLLSNVTIRKRIGELTAPRLTASALTLENTLAQIAAISQFDKRKLFDENGKRIPVHLLDDKTAAAISHMGAHDLVPFDKLKALDMSAKYLGAYEKDNAQKVESLQMQIILE